MSNKLKCLASNKKIDKFLKDFIMNDGMLSVIIQKCLESNVSSYENKLNEVINFYEEEKKDLECVFCKIIFGKIKNEIHNYPSDLFRVTAIIKSDNNINNILIAEYDKEDWKNFNNPLVFNFLKNINNDYSYIKTYSIGACYSAEGEISGEEYYLNIFNEYDNDKSIKTRGFNFKGNNMFSKYVECLRITHHIIRYRPNLINEVMINEIKNV